MVYEITLNGFDGSSDKTDGKILWIQAKDILSVNAYLEKKGFKNFNVCNSDIPDDSPGINVKI